MENFKTVGDAVSFCKQFGLEIDPVNIQVFAIAEALKLASESSQIAVVIEGTKRTLKAHDHSLLLCHSSKSNIATASVCQHEDGRITVHFDDEQDYLYAEANLGKVSLTSELLQNVVDKAIEATKDLRHAPTKHGEEPVRIELD